MKYYWAMWHPSRHAPLLLEEVEMMARRGLDSGEYLQVDVDPSARQFMVFYTTPEQAYKHQLQLNSRRLRLTPSTAADFECEARPTTPAKKPRLHSAARLAADPAVPADPAVAAARACPAILCVDLEPGDILQSWVQRDGGIAPTQNYIQLRLLDQILYVNDKDPWTLLKCNWLDFNFAVTRAQVNPTIIYYQHANSFSSCASRARFPWTYSSCSSSSSCCNHPVLLGRDPNLPLPGASGE